MRAVFTSQTSKTASMGHEDRQRIEKRQLRDRKEDTNIRSIDGQRDTQKDGTSKGGSPSETPNIGTENDGTENELHGTRRLKAQLRKQIEGNRKEKRVITQNKTGTKNTTAKSKINSLLKGGKHDRINELFLKSRKTVANVRKASSDTDIKSAQISGSRGASSGRSKVVRKAKSEVESDDIHSKHEASKPLPKGKAQVPSIPGQVQNRYAFMKNVRPSKLELALRYAKPAVDIKSVPLSRKPTKQPKPTIATKADKSGAGEKGAPRSTTQRRDVGIGDIEISRIVSLLRQSKQQSDRSVPWLASPTTTAAIVCLVAVFVLCIDMKYVVLLLLIPLLQKSMDEAFKRFYKTDYHLVRTEESKNQDVLQKIVHEVEARTTAKIKRQLFHNMSTLE